MERIIEKAKNFKYTAFNYIDVEELENGYVEIENEKGIFVSKELDEKIRVYWAANSKEVLLNGMRKVIENIKDKYAEGKKVQVQFIPEDFIPDMQNLGFEVFSEWVDFWSNDLSEQEINTQVKIRDMNAGEHVQVAEVTKACRGYSRGFMGESDESIKEWNESDNSKVFVAELEDKIVGMCMINLYGFESEKGTVLWLREIAVSPEYQSKGIGRSLMSQAFKWGKDNGAKRSFLASDAENHKAIRVYESFGYKKQEGPGQIDMEKDL